MHRFSATRLSLEFKKGTYSAEEIVRYFFERIEQYEPRVDAFLTILKDRALHKAQELDAKKRSGESLGRLAGVPFALKDNINAKGEISTCGSKILANFRAPFDATVTRLIEEEDAILIGKTNCDEFAMGSSTENSAFKPTKNPWKLTASPGGSSGGSAAAVAARMCPLAFGSDTGGSIRQPASLCGIVGFKPNYGRVSRYGLVAFGSSLDQIGPLTTSVEDAALTMEIIGRHCPHDSTSIPQGPDKILEGLDRPIKGMKIGIPWHFLEGLEPEYRKSFDESLEVMKHHGASLVEVDLSILRYALAVYYIIAPAEASTNLARFDGVRYGMRSPRAKTLDELYDFSRQEGLGPEVKRRIMLGTFVLSSGYQDAYYRKAQKVRALIIQKYNQAFAQCDLVATPVSPFAAFELGSIKDPLQMYLADIYSVGANIAGLPSISIPSGFTADGRPIGFGLTGGQLREASLFNAAFQFQKATSFHTMLPKEFP
jgi:aspartyl-tRNA(Asn)/glutamyl-tRNA(Gln) amidotransferase subunit A